MNNSGCMLSEEDYRGASVDVKLTIAKGCKYFLVRRKHDAIIMRSVFMRLSVVTRQILPVFKNLITSSSYKIL